MALHAHTDVLLALALDLLSQAEAHQRAATRLEAATRVLADGRERRGTADSAHARQVRDQISTLQELATTNRHLLSEFSRELDSMLGKAR